MRRVGYAIAQLFCILFLFVGATFAYGHPSPLRQNVTLPTSEPVAQGDFIGPFIAEQVNDSVADAQFLIQRYLIDADGEIEWFEPKVETLGAGETALNIYFIKVPEAYSEGEYTAGLVMNDKVGAEIQDDSFRVLVQMQSYTNSLGMEFKLIRGGTFLMGTPPDETGRGSDEQQHVVKISKPYYVQTTEVTQHLYEKVMGNNPSYWSGCPRCPVEKVSWYDAQEFISKLNAMGEGFYRLPTEAEWEFACRAGSETAFYNGDITRLDCEYDPNLDKVGIYCGNSDRTVPVAQKEPNAWGLYDMHGNVWEWCQNWYGEYPENYVEDPKGPVTGWAKVFRGGTFYYDSAACRSGNRGRCGPTLQRHGRGFRVVREK